MRRRTKLGFAALSTSLRKALTQRQHADLLRGEPHWPAAMSHMLLLAGPGEREAWFESHPPLQERIRRIYGRRMQALPLEPPGAAGIPS